MTQLPTGSPSTSSQGSTKLVIVAIVIAGAALLLVNAYIEYVRTQATEDTFVLYRLKHGVKPGTKFDSDMVEKDLVPERFKDTFKSAIDEDGLDVRIGWEIHRYAEARDILTWDLFNNPGKDEMGRRIQKGKRLVALPVNPRHAARRAAPGMYVDIRAPFPGSKLNVKTVMEDVKVMALGDYTIVDEERAHQARPSTLGNFTSISVEIDQDQADQFEMIKMLATGEFIIHVRNPGDLAFQTTEQGRINPEVLRLLEQGQRGSATARQ